LLGSWILLLGWIFKPMVSGKVPIPLDVMVGGYFPWLDYKWGYPAGVPYKNPSLTDVFSQTFPWRILAVDAFRQGRWPLWNPYSFSGAPLLANWQSAPFYPLNILMLLFGNTWGWSMMCVLEPFLAGIFLYLMLRVHRLTKPAAYIGGITFALSGFMMTYMEYNTTGQIFMWTSLLIILAKKYQFTGKQKYLWFAPWVIFWILTGGFFQPALYALAAAGLYWLIAKIKIKYLLQFFGLGILISSLQLIPTWELLKLSVRTADPNIVNYNFGLLPGKILITLLAPDFFGNPATGNYFGFMGYQETSGYAGVAAVVLAITAIFTGTKKHKSLKITAIILLFLGIGLAFDNPVSQLVYRWRLPLISTGYASRNLLFLSFSLAVLASLAISNLEKGKTAARWIFCLLGGLLVGYLIVARILPTEISSQIKVTCRNLVIPAGLAGLIYVILLTRLSRAAKTILILTILTGDLGRFAIKFLPFADAGFAQATIPVMDFLKANTGNFRVERDKGSLPPNTWTYFKLMSPSGYDPLFPKDYAKFYRVYAHGDVGTGALSRYAETEKWDSPLLDLAGVKYVLTTKKNPAGVIDKEGQDLSYTFRTPRYEKAFTDQISVALENKTVMPRTRLYYDYVVAPGDQPFQSLAENFDFRNIIILDREPENIPGGSASSSAIITSYKPEAVEINVETEKPGILFLSDTDYPGWKAIVNDQPTPIIRAFGTFRAIEVPAGKSQVKFRYQSRSFTYGLILSGLGLVILLSFPITSVLIKCHRERTK